MDVVDVDPAEAALAKLAAMDLSLATHLHACAMNADDPAEIVNLSRAYQRIARSTRQSIALHARMKRERERAERDTPPAPQPAPGPPPPPRDERRIRERREAVEAAVRRVAWSEYERCDADEDLEDRDMFLDVIRDVLIKAARHDTFGLTVEDDDWVEEPLDDHIARVCADFDLPADLARSWRDLPDPAPDDQDSS